MARRTAVFALTVLLLVDTQAGAARPTRGMTRGQREERQAVEPASASRPIGLRRFGGALLCRGRAVRARLARSTVARAVSGRLPTPRSRAKAFGLGVIEGPWHTVEHLANPKALAIAVGTTAGLGVVLHLTGVPAALVAAPVLLGVLAQRWVRGVRDMRRAPPGPERARILGRQVAATAEITAELAGVHALHPHGGEGEAAHAAATTAKDIGAAALQGVLGFHELFYVNLFEKRRHEHGH